MGRIIPRVTVANLIDPSWAMELDALVDTPTAALVLPSTWRERLGVLRLQRTVDAETADQRTIEAQVCGPVRIQVEGFPAVASEVTFLAMEPLNGRYEPLLGHIILEQSQAAMDMVGHRLVPVKHVDLR